MEKWREIAHRIDQQAQEVTTWEAKFLATLLTQPWAPSGKQLAVLTTMTEVYLGWATAAELHGQQRFWHEQEDVDV